MHVEVKDIEQIRYMFIIRQSVLALTGTMPIMRPQASVVQFLVSKHAMIRR